MFDPISILAALIPVGVDAGKALIRKYIAPDQVKPTTIEELARLNELEIDRLRVLAELDKVGNVHLWVNDLRGAMRPVVALTVTAAWCIRPDLVDSFIVSSVWFYLFGERTLTK